MLADGVASQNSGEVRIALDLMKDAGATITTSESIIFQLLGDAQHPNFKEIAKLIKESKEETAKAVAMTHL